MEISVTRGGIVDQDAHLLVLFTFVGAAAPEGPAAAVDAALGGAIREAMAAGDISGKTGQSLLLYGSGHIPARRVLVVGLGEQDRFDRMAARNAAAAALREARKLGARSVAAAAKFPGKLGVEEGARALAEGALLGLYRFRGYKSSQPADWKQDPEGLFLVAEDGDVGACERGIARARAIANGVIMARDMVNEPANYMTPAIMAGLATEMANEVGLRVQVLEKADMAGLGMGILLAVAAESEQPPKLIALEHNAPGDGAGQFPTVVLVGKGVTFDSGGISIKPAEDMWRMKSDMAGGAAVIGALGVAARLELPLHVVGLVPCAENLPGGRAQKPGDVFTGMTGKTMEVISTDAEGRMLLADALAYAGRYKPDAVVDIATLTGAQSIALGPQAAGVFVNDEALSSRLLAAADASGERLWRLPLYDEYLETIKSQVADVKNTGGRYGGVGTSAKFIEHFTEGYPWAHIDMASMAWSEEDKPARPKGATGYGVRLFTEFLEGWTR